jgi:glucose-1-phosphate cytidylyltransferase
MSKTNQLSIKPDSVPVVILCGGQGTRIREVSEVIPKPMIPIGGRPILWHIMKIYASHGFTNFVLCLGYKGWLIKEFFLNYRMMLSDITISLGRHSELEFHNNVEEAQWRVTLADTGENTMTGGRVRRIKEHLNGCSHFCLTYGDGVGDVDLGALLSHHLQSGLTGTLTGVRVAGRFGKIECVDCKITAFDEKPPMSADRINGGFMVFDANRVWDYFDDRSDLVLESETLSRLAADGQLGIFEHDGFWQCMDTPREYHLLNEIWESGRAQWKIW